MQATLRRSLVLLSLIMLPLLGVELAMQFSLRQERMAELHDQAMRLLDGVETEQQRLIDDVHHILGTLATAAAPQLAGAGCQATLDRVHTQLPSYLVIEVMGMGMSAARPTSAPSAPTSANGRMSNGRWRPGISSLATTPPRGGSATPS